MKHKGFDIQVRGTVPTSLEDRLSAAHASVIAAHKPEVKSNEDEKEADKRTPSSSTPPVGVETAVP